MSSTRATHKQQPKPLNKEIADSITWISVKTDSGIVHAAVIIPKGKGPFPAVIILHGTHGFAQEYVQLARSFANRGYVGIAACWFAGRKGDGVRFITPIEFPDAPPLVDEPGLERFRLSRNTIDMLLQKVETLAYVKKQQVSLFGHSRGAGAVLDYSLNHPGKVMAIAMNSGGYPEDFTRRAGDVSAPIIILHGTGDSPAQGGSPLTHVDKAREFEAALRAANKPVSATYFQGSDHNFIFTTPSQFENSVQLVSDFLRSHSLK